MHKHRYLILVLAVALLTRLGLLVAVWGSDVAALGIDPWSYMEPSKNLLTMGEFWRSDFVPKQVAAHQRPNYQATGQPETFRTPGYPVFLILCGLGQNYQYGFAQIVQVLLGVGTVLLTYLLGVRLASRPAGLWAAAFQAFSIGCILTSIWIGTECLFSFLLALILLLLVRHFQEGTRWAVPLAAVLTAAATYVRPVGIVFVPVAIAVLLYPSLRAWRRAAEFALIFAALVAPWYVRNYAAGYDGFSSVGDENLLKYEAVGVLAKIENKPVAVAEQELEDLHAQRIKELGFKPYSGPAMKIAREMGKRIIYAHPLVWARMHAITSLNAFLPASSGLLQALGITTGQRGTLALLQSEGVVAAAKHYFNGNVSAILLVLPEVLFLGIQYGLSALFVFVAIRRNKLHWSRSGWLMALTALVFLFVGGPAAMSRFRVPVEPLINVAAAAGLTALSAARRAPLSDGKDQL